MIDQEGKKETQRGRENGKGRVRDGMCERETAARDKVRDFVCVRETEREMGEKD